MRVHSSPLAPEVLNSDSGQILSGLFRLVPKQAEQTIEKTESKPEVIPTRSYSEYFKKP